MDLKTLQFEFEALEKDESLEIEQNLKARVNAIDFIAYVLEFVRWHSGNETAMHLQRRAESLKYHLLSLNERLYRSYQQQIRAGNYSPQDLRRQFDQYTNYLPIPGGVAHIGPDSLDVLVGGILGIDACLTATDPQHPDMIHYEPTPASVVLDLIDNADLQSGDILYDLGAGLGQVVILVNLLSRIQAKGIEINPYLCDRARAYANQLGRGEVEFINADACNVDYADGSVFYMFTPFKGLILQTVLDKLRQEGQNRKIRLCTYGSCTPQVAKQSWVRSIDANANHEFKLAIFESA